MIWWLILSLFCLGVIAFLIFAKKEYKVTGIHLAILAVCLIVCFFWLYNANCEIAETGQALAREAISSKRFEGKINGNVVEISAKKFDVSKPSDRYYLNGFLIQANSVDEIMAVQNNPWINWFYPKIDKPLLKIVIVK